MELLMVPLVFQPFRFVFVFNLWLRDFSILLQGVLVIFCFLNIIGCYLFASSFMLQIFSAKYTNTHIICLEMLNHIHMENVKKRVPYLDVVRREWERSFYEVSIHWSFTEDVCFEFIFCTFSFCFLSYSLCLVVQGWCTLGPFSNTVSLLSIKRNLHIIYGLVSLTCFLSMPLAWCEITWLRDLAL